MILTPACVWAIFEKALGGHPTLVICETIQKAKVLRDALLAYSEEDDDGMVEKPVAEPLTTSFLPPSGGDSIELRIVPYVTRYAHSSIL